MMTTNNKKRKKLTEGSELVFVLLAIKGARVLLENPCDTQADFMRVTWKKLMGILYSTYL